MFKGYTPFIVIVKHWLYSPCGTLSKDNTINILASVNFENFCDILATYFQTFMGKKKRISGGGTRNLHAKNYLLILFGGCAGSLLLRTGFL